jgi:hypothetical protein
VALLSGYTRRPDAPWRRRAEACHNQLRSMLIMTARTLPPELQIANVSRDAPTDIEMMGLAARPNLITPSMIDQYAEDACGQHRADHDIDGFKCVAVPHQNPASPYFGIAPSLISESAQCRPGVESAPRT